MHRFLLIGLLAAIGVSATAQSIYPLPAKVFGQAQQPRTLLDYQDPKNATPNFVEGKEFNAPLGVAVDTSRTPFALYVADTNNNRVLGWKDAQAFANGATADLVLGQDDLFSTRSLILTTTANNATNSHLLSPTAVAAAPNGDVFVLDTGNNRILRFPAPFAALEAGNDYGTADLVLGQKNLKTFLQNQGASLLDATQIYTATRTTAGAISRVFWASLRFDADGNLWLADAGNHRILRFPASVVSGSSNLSASKLLEADLVLGQTDFTTRTTIPATDRKNKSHFSSPGTLAFDNAGHLLVADDYARVLVFTAPFANGKAADRLLGLYVPSAGQSIASSVLNDTAFSTYAVGTNVYFQQPQGLFSVNGDIFVSDTINNRILRFDPVASWPAESATVISPAAKAVFGQTYFDERKPNNGDFFEPSERTFNSPAFAAAAGNEVYLLDSGNHRLLVLPYDEATHALLPSLRLLGAAEYHEQTVNRIEGKEFTPTSISLYDSTGKSVSIPLEAGAAIDYTQDQARLYITDTLNNRILCFPNARTFKPGDWPEFIIGQVSSSRGLINSPTGDPAQPGPNGLYRPSALAVDNEGNLWVADTLNGRVLRFPRPFDNREGWPKADLVLGQAELTTKLQTPAVTDRATLQAPAGLAFTPEGHLVVSDIAQNRVLLFRAPFTSGMAASLLLGQSDDTATAAGKDSNNFAAPLGVAVDSFGRLYVADYANARISAFDNLNAQVDNAPASFLLPLANSGYPVQLTLSKKTEQLWVADGRYARVLLYPQYDQWLLSSTVSPLGSISTGTTAARHTLLDKSDNPLIFDTAGRVAMFYPTLSAVNGANSFPILAPNAIAELSVPGVTLTGTPESATGPTLPKSLADTEVLIGDGATPFEAPAAPLSRVSEGTARLVIPKDTPGTGSVNVLVRRISTGEVLAYSRLNMSPYSPGLLAATGKAQATGTVAAAKALNSDGTTNSSAAPGAAGKELTVFMTGLGAAANLPEDGTAPADNLAFSGDMPNIYLMVSSTQVIAAGAATAVTADPTEPGLWRVKFKVPTIPANGTYGVIALYKSMSSQKANIVSGSTTTTLTVTPTVVLNK